MGVFLVMFGVALLLIGAIVSNANEVKFVLVSVAVVVLSALSFHTSIINREDKGGAVSLDVLVTGEKYEIVDIYEKYIIIKSAADNGNNEKLKFIGPLDFGTITLNRGKYVKTAKSLEKLEK